MNTKERLEVLKAIDIFKLTPDAALIALASSLTEEFYVPGDTIIREGDYNDCMFIIVYGTAKVTVNNNEMATLKAHEVFGELAALAPEKRIASVTANSELLTLKINHNSLYDAINTNIGFAKGLILLLCQRYRKLNRKMREMAQ